MRDIGMCNVCGQRPAKHVGSGPGPVSWGYCDECRASGASPYGGLVAYLYTLRVDEQLSTIHPSFHEHIDTTLAWVGKTRADFVRDCQAAWEDYLKYEQEQQAAESANPVYDIDHDDFF